MNARDKVLPALDRLSAIDEVASVFVFNGIGDVLGSAMPEHYTEENLRQVGARILNTLNKASGFESEVGDLLLRFENYVLYVKVFGKGYYLAVFCNRDADISLLVQPINLAVLNLDKSVQAVEQEVAEGAAQSDLAKAAREAEKHLYEMSGEDSNGYFGILASLATFYLGPCGAEILEDGIREHELTLPFEGGEGMRKVSEFAAKEVGSPELRDAFLSACYSLIERLEWDEIHKKK